MSIIEILLEILTMFISFFKIALFNFGGGFAMYTLMESEVVSHGWMTTQQFSDIFAIAQMTPGPVSINAATYIGYTKILEMSNSVLFALSGSLISTLAIPIPSFFIVILISPYILKYKQHPMYKMVFYGLKAVVVGLVIDASIKVAQTTLINLNKIEYSLNYLRNQFDDFHVSFNLGSIFIFILSYVLIKKYKLNPILIIVIAALLGIIVFSFL